MIVVDTSVWADHFHSPIPALNEHLSRDAVFQHAFVTGEIAMGNLQFRKATIGFLESIEAAPVSSDKHLLDFVASNDLGGTGIGFVDAHLLASVSLLKARLWTFDRRLGVHARRLDLAYAR